MVFHCLNIQQLTLLSMDIWLFVADTDKIVSILECVFRWTYTPISLRYVSRSRIARSKGRYMVSFCRWCQSARFYQLSSHQQYLRVPVTLHPCQSVLGVGDLLNSVRSGRCLLHNFIVVFNGIFLMNHPVGPYLLLLLANLFLIFYEVTVVSYPLC